jgi:hypothetical protein
MTISKYILRILFLFYVLQGFEILYAEQLLTVQTVIDSFEKSIVSRGAYSFHFKDQYGQSGDINYDGQNLRVIQYLQRGNQLSNFAYCEGVRLRETFLKYENNPETKEPTLLSMLKPTPKDMFVCQFFNYNYVLAIIPWGNYTYEDTIANTLRSSILTIKQENDGNIHLQGRKGDYFIDAVFIHQGDFILLKHFSTYRDFEQSKLTLDNVLDIVTFSVTFDQYSQVGSTFFPELVIAETKFVLTNWQEINGKHVRIPYIPKISDRKEITVTDCKLNCRFSKKDFSLTNKVANMTLVTMLDVPQIEYVWFNGEVVPLTDEIALARIRGHGFIPGVREPRFWLIVSGILMMALALGLKIKDFFYNSKQKKGD